jgi:hypothetical protein
MADNNMEPQEEMTVTLNMDDGSEVECVVLTIFEAAGLHRTASHGRSRGGGGGSLPVPLQ